MHVQQLLHKLLGTSIHKTRIRSLTPVISTILMTKQLSLTRLGRSLPIKGKERAGIRRMDRLLSNRYYQNDNLAIYETITRYVVGNKTCPVIIVDWSKLPNSHRRCEQGAYYVLRASLAAPGRSLTLYDEVHPEAKLGNVTVHNEFLQKLKQLLPPNCSPIIVTDAGFRNPWFKKILSLDWDYIGRVRGAPVQYDDGSGFKSIQTLFAHASSTPKSLGEITLSKRSSLQTNVYLYRHQLQGRKRRTKLGKLAKDKDSQAQARGYREPWVLVSSLAQKQAAKKVVKLYKMRMTCEENFRDMKSIEFGLSLHLNKTIKTERYIVWLMLAALASLMAWIVGFVAEQQQLHYHFQANTCRHKRVLSFFFLGCQVIRKKIKLQFQFYDIPNIACLNEQIT